MIGHHNPLPQNVTLPVKKLHGPGNQFGDVGPAQMASPNSIIEVSLHLPQEIPVDALLVVGHNTPVSLRVIKGPKALRLLSFETKQYVLRQRVRQPESNEIIGPFPLDMWQVPARVNTATLRIDGRVLDTGRSKLITDSLQSRILGFGHRHSVCERGRTINAQRRSAGFQPAVSPISNRQRVDVQQRPQTGLRSAGWKPCDTAG